MALRKYFIRALGSKKSYLFLKIESSIILSVIFSILYTLFGSYLFIFQIFPAVILFSSFSELYSEYRREFWASFLIFFILFLIVLLTPFLFQMITVDMGNPLMLLRYMVYIAFGLITLLILSRKFLLKKEVYGKVLLADKDTAAVELDFDLFAGIKPGKYVVENKGAKKGDLVRITVKKGFFRGAYPNKIIGKVKA